jgi:hypothetical protein
VGKQAGFAGSGAKASGPSETRRFLISRANTAELIARAVIVDEETVKLMMSDKIVRLSPRPLRRRRLSTARRCFNMLMGEIHDGGPSQAADQGGHVQQFGVGLITLEAESVGILCAWRLQRFILCRSPTMGGFQLFKNERLSYTAGMLFNLVASSNGEKRLVLSQFRTNTVCGQRIYCTHFINCLPAKHAFNLPLRRRAEVGWRR